MLAKETSKFIPQNSFKERRRKTSTLLNLLKNISAVVRTLLPVIEK